MATGRLPSGSDVCQRIEKSYQLFFRHHKKGVRPSSFKTVRKYKSFTLKQAGYIFLGNGKIKIGKRIYQFWDNRELEGKVKTVTVKRNTIGEIFIYVVTDPIDETQIPMSGKTAGLDFGLKTVLSISDGSQIPSPLFFDKGVNQIRVANQSRSRKAKGSRSREKARKHLARTHEKIANQRKDWCWKLAHELTDKYNYFLFEMLNLKAMQCLWGRKVSDLAFREFLQILEFVAFKKGKAVQYIDRWYPSSKT